MTLVSSINTAYQSALERTDPTAQRLDLNQRLLDSGMEWQGEPFPTYLKPYFVDQAVRQKMADATRLLVSCLEKIGTAHQSGRDFSGLIRHRGRVGDLLRIDPLYPNHHVIVRIDAFFNPATASISVLEFNCSDPSGLGWNDALVQAFVDLPAVRAVRETYDIQADRLLETHQAAMIAMYRAWCAARDVPPEDHPSTAVVCWKASPIVSDFRLIVDHWVNEGYRCILADPEQFEYDGARLTVNGHAVELVYRDTIDDFTKAGFWPTAQAILRAYRDGNVCLVNPVRAVTGDNKAVLAIVADDRFADLFTEEERSAAREYVPWTRMVEDRTVEYDGRLTNLVDLLRQNKDRFVLKPNQGYGGIGVIIGRSCDQARWHQAVDAALARPGSTIVQQFVEVPTERFPRFDGDRLIGWSEKHVNINLWSHAGEFVGAFLRAADGEIINVHQGGGLVPVLFAARKANDARRARALAHHQREGT